jgi:hypothetical protein
VVSRRPPAHITRSLISARSSPNSSCTSQMRRHCKFVRLIRRWPLVALRSSPPHGIHSDQICASYPLKASFIAFKSCGNCGSNSRKCTSVVFEFTPRYQHPALQSHQVGSQDTGSNPRKLVISFESSDVGAGCLNPSDSVDQLEPLPQLKSLTMHIPHPKVLDPIRLRRLPHNHASTLRDVRLDLSGLSDAPSGCGEGRLVPLMTELLSDERLFTNLESFTFSRVALSMS